ncbi:hypothetical protein BACIT_3576 [Bacillus amyloliquefaciens]|nr:hypothetical protein BACIT_3576 [Bacillus amyloliquefaciens]
MFRIHVTVSVCFQDIFVAPLPCFLLFWLMRAASCSYVVSPTRRITPAEQPESHL